MMSKTMIKVICIIMAALMLLSACAVLVQVFAADEGAAMSFVSPATGDSGSDYYVPAGIAVAAVLAVVLCLVLPKMKKKDVSAQKEKASVQKKSQVQSDKVKTVGRTVTKVKTPKNTDNK